MSLIILCLQKFLRMSYSSTPQKTTKELFEALGKNAWESVHMNGQRVHVVGLTSERGLQLNGQKGTVVGKDENNEGTFNANLANLRAHVKLDAKDGQAGVLKKREAGKNPYTNKIYMRTSCFDKCRTALVLLGPSPWHSRTTTSLG